MPRSWKHDARTDAGYQERQPSTERIDERYILMAVRHKIHECKQTRDEVVAAGRDGPIQDRLDELGYQSIEHQLAMAVPQSGLAVCPLGLAGQLRKGGQQ